MSHRPSHQDVLVATIGRPHGVRGLVRLHPATEHPETLEELGPLHDETGSVWQIRWKAPGIAAVLGQDGQPLPDRTAAEKLVNRKLYVAREALPEVEEDEFYHIDLIGMEAVLASGETVGRVVSVHDYGAGTSLELEAGQLIPFTMACVPEVDMEAKRLVVVPPEAVEVEGDLAGEVEVRS